MRLAALPAALLLLPVSGCADDPIMTSPGERSSGRPAGWTQVQDAPLAGRTGANVVGVGSDAYVFGGSEFLCPPGADCAGPSTPPFADGAVLNIETGSWRPMSDAPFGFSSASTAVVDDLVSGEQIYVLAGRRLLRYAPADDTWSRLGQLPARVGSSLVATDHGLVAFAGSDENGTALDAVRDPVDGTWTTLPDDPLPASYDRFAVADGDRLLVFASPVGEPDEEVRAKVAAAYDWYDGTWSELPTAPGGGYQAWRIDDRVFLNPHFGPDGGGVLDLATDTWGAIPDDGEDWDGEDWGGDAAGVIGSAAARYEYSHGWVFDARDDSWREVPARVSEVYDESVGSVLQDLVVFGGQVWKGDDGELSSETWVWHP